jgi:short-subunit dehydrogenase
MLTLLTGASRGIGARIAEDLARDGGTLVLVARDPAGLAATAARVEALGAAAIVLPADLADPAEVDRVAAEVLARGAPDRVVLNAGIEITVAVLDQSPDDMARQLALNLASPLRLTRALLPAMVGAGRGAIVAISSMSGKTATPYNAVYTATKHGLNGFFASLRIELWETGVHCGVVCPSFVAETGMWSDTGVQAPPLLREVSPAAVTAAVRRALGGAPEVLVTPAPMRPLLALGQLFPRLDGAVLRALGVLDTLRARARAAAGRRHDGPM